MRRPLMALLLLLAPLFSHAQELPVRVLLDRVAGEVRVPVSEAHSGYLGDELLFETPLALDWPVTADGGALIVEGVRFYRPLTLVPHSRQVSWKGRRYRGALSLVAAGDELLVINLLELEEYLRGVVPAEMMPEWPLEALKAQAVASRTYTLTSLDAAAPFDICATIDCQVYEGIDEEHLRTDLAVAQTAGLVLTFQGDFARTYYHSDSGGAVASSAEVWGTALPYLASRNDVASTTPHRRWRQTLDPRQMSLLLARLGHQLGTVQALRVIAYSDSGRALRAQVVGSAGSVTLAGSQLTTLLRESGLKSTRFTMIADLVAQGDGWGHGVGMSQYGARSLAASGHTFDSILRFYYPQTSLQRLATPAESP